MGITYKSDAGSSERPFVNITFPASGEGNSTKILKALNLLLRVGESQMTAITDFVNAQVAYNQRMDASIRGIGDDVKSMSDKIAQLQTGAGALSSEEQTLISELDRQSANLAGRLEEIDAMKAPEPPQSPEPPPVAPAPPVAQG